MKKIIIGIGGITNGGKTTLAKKLNEQIPNSCIIAQDTYFKDDSLVAVDSHGFKQYDVIDAIDMDEMMTEVQAWRKDSASFLASRGLTTQHPSVPEVADEVYVLIIEGFLIYNYRPLSDIIHRKYFLHIPYDTCRKRRCSRVYAPPDPPGYFDGHVWPSYLKNRKEVEDAVSDLVYLDGMRSVDDLHDVVYEEIKILTQQL